MKTFNLSFAMTAALALGFAAQAEIIDRPQGFKIGERMTLRPYVNFEYMYDSNADSQPESDGSSSWYANPNLDLTYKGEHFTASANVFYGYRAYTDNARSENEHNYGESLRLAWTSAAANEKGWSVLLNERFRKVNSDDSLQNYNGRGLWRERYELNLDAAVQRRFTEKWHASINGGYYLLDYDNDGEQYMNLYGWQRLMAGLEVGYAASRWTDIILAAGYQSYVQENCDDLSRTSSFYGTQDKYERESSGFTVQGGLQSYATDRISYRVLAGWSRFEYAGDSSDNGFTYSVSANWKISDTWNTMLLAQSCYQPSEREFGAANRVDTVSWGLAHTMIRGKLNAMLDLAYRRETRSQNDASAFDYDEDIFSARLGLDYTINRFLGVYARGEYQGCWFDGDMGGIDRDYNRFRLSVGVRLQY